MRENAKEWVEGISLERIKILFELAEKEFSKKPQRSKRYVEIARRIARRNRIRMPLEYKKRFCKKCCSYLKIGRNARIRAKKKYLVLMCLECGHSRKIGIGKNE